MKSVQGILLYWIVPMDRNSAHLHDRGNEQRIMDGLASWCARREIDDHIFYWFRTV